MKIICSWACIVNTKYWKNHAQRATTLTTLPVDANVFNMLRWVFSINMHCRSLTFSRIQICVITWVHTKTYDIELYMYSICSAGRFFVHSTCIACVHTVLSPETEISWCYQSTGTLKRTYTSWNSLQWQVLWFLSIKTNPWCSLSFLNLSIAQLSIRYFLYFYTTRVPLTFFKNLTCYCHT